MTIVVGDCRDALPAAPDGWVQTVVTSPPYFGLRDYGTGQWEGGDPGCLHVKSNLRLGSGMAALGERYRGGGRKAGEITPIHYGQTCERCGAVRTDQQLGLESTPEAYVAALVDVFREIRRVLADDGTLWLNLGDSYAGSWKNQGRKAERGTQRPIKGGMLTPVLDGRYPDAGSNTGAIPSGASYKTKDLLGIPWMVAFALRADGWYLRSDIIWAKPNPMPESVRDRPTKAHEYLFLFSKSRRYYYDADAIREGYAETSLARYKGDFKAYGAEHDFGRKHGAMRDGGTITPNAAGRNRRTVWTIPTKPFPEAHFATFPPALVEPCILAGSKLGDIVLDPFAGAGTVGVVCEQLGREFVGIELNPEYAAIAERRIAKDGRPGERKHDPPPVLPGQMELAP